MTTTSPTVFVTGATGSQGSAVARQLRDIGWSVQATARNLESPVAKELQALGVEVTAGDWDNEAALEAAIEGCSFLFLNLTPNIATFSSEVPYAKRILAIAKSADVKHVIYSSAMAVKDLEKGKYYNPEHPVYRAHKWKGDIEELVKGGGFDAWTILRGGFFMCNFLAPKVNMMYPDLVQTNKWTTAYTSDVRMPMMDVEDIAKFAVAAFQDPGRFNEQTIAIASEKLSPEEITQQLGEATGKHMSSVFLTQKQIEEKIGSDLFVLVQLMSRDLGDKVDIESVKSWGVPMGTFKHFLQREHGRVESTYS
ncbi:hypothetical protein FSARC_5359 [Fusarium sarcochroum]|uniref:NmrA-like domain-containing protein n=1 Tax=Fusarium sarcochroum TaxID=1208366 RepID=A0A8H4X9M2_9HYPO|nr:hypothetical protein FSARC_5359 [Fusarium sarcochroum]